MALAGLEVIGIVSGRHLDGSGAELGLRQFVEDDRDLAANQRQLHLLAVQMRVALIARIDGHGGVAQHRLRTRGGHDNGFAGQSDDGIANLPELTLSFVMHHFQIAERGHAARTPVDDVGAAIDQILFPEAHKGFAHGAREVLIHGEELARPIDRIAEALHLLQDVSAVLLFPLPDALEEGFAAQVLTLLALAGQLPFHHHLRGDSSVVGSRAATSNPCPTCAASGREYRSRCG